MSSSPDPSPGSLAPASAGGNRWRELEPLDAEATRSTRVSVICDGTDPRSLASHTHAALGRSEHPAELTEVLSVEEAGNATGEVVILLAAGSEPAPGLITEHLRRQLAATDVVCFGSAPPLEEGALEPLGLAMDMTRDLMEPVSGTHLLGALGNVSLRREKLEAVGGLSTRRIELAARLESHGSLFVPIPEAASPTPYDDRGSAMATAVAEAGTTELRSIEAGWPTLGARVALPPFRRLGSTRRHLVPAALVNVDVGEASDEEAAATVSALLASETADAEIRVQSESAGPLLEAAVDADDRASFGRSSLDGFCASPIQLVVPGVALPDRRTLGDLMRLVIEDAAGALHVTVPGAPPQETMIEVFRSGALGRARRVAEAADEPVEVVLGRMFGERWVSGVEVSVRRHGVEEPQVTEHGPLAAATDRDHERVQHLRFRDRALDMAEKAERLRERTASERLKAREFRNRADELETELAAIEKPPRLWRLRPARTAASKLKQRFGGESNGSGGSAGSS
ncbi:hypothetical protein HJD18_12775 [Thermoleophilia bacterium SCSIO 60948]|nr:hypothetical protein HJD18_12775 [Thermoleophilia bacterium SCSIO 60948]